jgi:hypothetical protein
MVLRPTSVALAWARHEGSVVTAEDHLRDRLRDPLRDRLRDPLRDHLGSTGTPRLCCSHAVFRGCVLCDISMPAGVLP